MATELFADNAATTLTSSPSAATTSFTVASSTGFPAAATGVSQFRVIIGTEIVTVTNVSGTTWTCNALAAGHTSGDAVTHVVTAGALGNLGAGGGDYFTSGEYSHGMPGVTTQAAMNIPTNWLQLRPFIVPARRAFDRIGLNVSTASAAGGVLRMGVYSASGGKPGTLITDFGTVSSTTTGAKEITISQTLDPGVYWLAVSHQGASGNVGVTGYGSSGTLTMPWVSVGTSVPTSVGGLTFISTGPVSGALPSSPGGALQSSGLGPMIVLRAT